MRGRRYLSIVCLSAVGLAVIFTACKKDDPVEEPPVSNAFDRRAMLEHWADHIIVPGLKLYQESLNHLVDTRDIFVAEQNIENLSTLRSAWLAAYFEWQKISMFDIGKAEEIGLRNFTNIYPADTDGIESNISKTDLNLALPSTFDAQGFPALDYLLFGLGDSDETILLQLGELKYQDYLTALIDRLQTLTTEVVNDWEAGYRDEFVNADGASATASTDKVVNDFLFYYERFLRAGKIGIPAGVFSGSKIPQAVEGRFAGVHSQELFLEGLNAVGNFFNGQGPIRSGTSLEDYLDHLADENGSSDIADAIQNHWRKAKSLAEGLDPNFQKQVEQDNASLLAVYDELQQAVILLKVDMMQALNIQVDYVDADGD